MTVVIAPDSFKGSLDQNGVAEAMAAGLARFRKDAAVVLRPMADGGEGTAAVIQRVRGGAFEPVTVDDAYGRPHEGRILFLPDRTAVIEAAAGPAYVAPNERPAPARNAHSRGLGMLMNAALARGARRVVVALGGTGSSDGGLGALRELGAKVAGTDALGASALADIAGVRLRAFPLPLDVWTDVLPPLSGPRGAIRGYGPQKGLMAEELPGLDRAMARWGAMLDAAAGRPVSTSAGAGAAGGLGAALAAIGGRLSPGGIAVARAIGLPAALAEASAVVTGEGAADAQSAEGKVVGVVARLARAAGVPTLVVAGRVAPTADVLYGLGAAALFALAPWRAPAGQRDRVGTAVDVEARMAEVSRWLDPGVLSRYRMSGR